MLQATVNLMMYLFSAMKQRTILSYFPRLKESTNKKNHGKKIVETKRDEYGTPSRRRKYGAREFRKMVLKRVCYICRQPGHYAQECPFQKNNGEGSPERIRTTGNHVHCYYCRKVGHIARNCLKRKHEMRKLTRGAQDDISRDVAQAGANEDKKKGIADTSSPESVNQIPC